MTKCLRKNVPDVRIELGAACMPSELTSNQATALGNMRTVYINALKTFNAFRQQYGLRNMWPATESQIACFLSYCFQQGFSPSSVSTYLSAISFIHKMIQFSDPTQSFFIKKIVNGFRRLRSRSDVRAPITYDILVKICQVLPFVCYNTYEALLFKTTFSLAYFGYNNRFITSKRIGSYRQESNRLSLMF